MLSEFTRTITIKPNDLAVELAESGDLVAIGAFLNTLAHRLMTEANKGSVDAPVKAPKGEYTTREITANLAMGLKAVVSKLQKDCNI